MVGVSDGDTITVLDDAKTQHKVRFAGIDAREKGQAFIRHGMAWHYKEYQHEQTRQDRLIYRDEEESAKARQIGLWRSPCDHGSGGSKGTDN